MKNDSIENLFETYKNQLDTEAPSLDHQTRFIDKLNKNKTRKNFSIWKFSAIAASLLLVVSLGLFMTIPKTQTELADVSPEMKKTQTFFNNIIQKELSEISKKNSPVNKKIISDVNIQLKVLEKNYKQLEYDLLKSNNDKRVIAAMITNFQKRVTLLKKTLKKIESVEQQNFKNQNKAL